MGFYFRKSKSFGPLRVNLSKSGIGVSAGVKGARVSVGPRGTYINAGRNGFYYRKKIGGKKAGVSKTGGSTACGPETSYQNPNVETAYECANTTQINESNTALSHEIIKKIWIGRVAFWIWLILSIFLIIELKTSGIVLAACFGFALLYFFSPKIEYELDATSINEWNNFLGAIHNIRKSNRVWIIENQLYNTNRKINAGSSMSVARSCANISKHEANGITGLKIRTNVKSLSIKSSKFKLLLLPNGIVAIKGLKIFAYPYDVINIISSNVHFVEREQISRDTEIVNYTWQYVNKNGTPDRRYNNNRQLPVCRYGVIQIYGVNLNIELETSNPYIVQGIGKVYEHYRAFLVEPPSKPIIDPIPEIANNTRLYNPIDEPFKDCSTDNKSEIYSDPIIDDKSESIIDNIQPEAEDNSREEWMNRVNRRKQAMSKKNEKSKSEKNSVDNDEDVNTNDNSNPVDNLFDFFDEV